MSQENVDLVVANTRSTLVLAAVFLPLLRHREILRDPCAGGRTGPTYVEGAAIARNFVGADTDGDNIPDVFKVSVTIDKLSCPA